MIIKVLSWNIWRGKNLDKVIKLLSELDAHIISLQEVAVINGQIQAEEIARKLNLNWFFCKTFSDDRHDSPKYDLGNAILSKFKISKEVCHLLSGLDLYKKDSGTEPRGAVEIELTVDGKKLTIINTHLAYSKNHRSSKIRDIQLNNLLSNQTIQQSNHLILMGDFNSLPESEEIKKVERVLVNADKNPTQPTWKGKRIDYIFVSPNIKVKSFKVLKSDASDHFPILAEIKI